MSFRRDAIIFKSFEAYHNTTLLEVNATKFSFNRPIHTFWFGICSKSVACPLNLVSGRLIGGVVFGLTINIIGPENESQTS